MTQISRPTFGTFTDKFKEDLEQNEEISLGTCRNARYDRLDLPG